MSLPKQKRPGDSVAISENKKPKRTIAGVIGDGLLTRRIDEYLSTVSDILTIDKDDMVETLRSKYKEYGRRNKAAFRNAVMRVYNAIVRGLEESFNMDDENEDYEDETDDGNMLTDEEDPMSDDSIQDKTISTPYNNGPLSYMQQLQKMTNSNVSNPDHDLINISSDDDEDDTPTQIKPPSLKIPSSKLSVVVAKETHNFHQNRMLPKDTILFRPTPPALNLRPLDIPQPPQLTTVVLKKRKGTRAPVPALTFKDFGGNAQVLKDLSQLVLHMKHPEIFRKLGVSPPRGFLLHGPPGCGKTLLAHAIAGELKIPLIKVAAPELVAGVSGESESRIRELFGEAIEQMPCVLFIDEVDAITPRRDNTQKDMERRIVAQLLSSLDELSSKTENDQILVIGATNRPDSVDPAMRRAGRFDREVCLGIPDRAARLDILNLICSKLRLHPDLSLESISICTPGYVGADLKSLISEAAIAAVNRIIEINTKTPPESCPKAEEKVKFPPSSVLDPGLRLTQNELDNLFIEKRDFEVALKKVQPSAKREGFATVPDVTWDDIGSLKDIRDQLQLSIMMPVKHPEEFAKLGVTSPTGIMLCGPPGCGKTLLAKAVANEANINFISVKGPELLNMYVGESERAVRQCFQRARNSHPCVIFFDELDALCPKRSDSIEGSASSRVVNQLLTEMDGIEGRTGVFLMAATNRPDMVDPAVLRPGRFDKILYVGLPNPEDRADILQALTKKGTKPPLGSDVCLEEIGKSESCSGFTGADLSALIKEASVQSLSEYLLSETKNSEELLVKKCHIERALDKIRPSVSEKDQKRYENLREQYGIPGPQQKT